MLITVQHHDHRWQVLPPGSDDAVTFADGAVAFDFADSLAREHHAETGSSSRVRVAMENVFVDAVQYG
ncbi:hypothetical protein [Stenotrophomonas sp. PS02289]|uniref:hypothetical protein n=1 Tax=Stenotrophomonas sp. PS02289 TaxID=2991422 RepID=UPI00249A6BA7|nr:hypothetical protein [Stenotrophomonas sp. PS02289]